MPNKESAIGVFDSGIRGLTVLQKIIEALRKENPVYLGATASAPYGTKSVETVLRYSFENTEFLVQKGVKAVVVACNTSTAIARTRLRNSPFDSCNRSYRASRTQGDQEYKE
jgi:glutamate racemase